MPRPLIAVLCAALAVAGCGVQQGEAASIAEDTSAGVTGTGSRSAELVIDELSRKDRIRQLIWPSVDTLDPGAAASLVRRTRPGGLIIMPRGTAKQWRAVVRAAQKAAEQAGLPPLLIAADQENGSLVRRMRMPVELPGGMALGAATASDGGTAAAAAADMTGRWLRSAGVTIDFAPVADVNSRPSNPVIGLRSPGAFPGLVGDTVVAQVEGFDAAQTLSTAKHFPGHGDTATDSHVGTATVTHSRAQMQRIDLPPFQAAIDAGIPAIMVAHVTAPALDDQPATLSRPIVTGILRRQMGFDGLVVSDSLGMGAVASEPDLGARVVKAGVDVLLMPTDPVGVADQVARAVGTKKLSKARLNQAVRHVVAAKQRIGALERAPEIPSSPSAARTRAVARDVGSASITILGSCRVLVRKGVTVSGYGAVADGVRAGLRAAGIGSGPVRVAVQSSPAGADIWVATGSPYSALYAGNRQRVLTYGAVAASGWAAGQAIAGQTGELGGLPVKGPKACPQLR